MPTAEVRFRTIPKGALTDRDVARMLELIALGFPQWPSVDPAVTPEEHLRWKTSSPGALFSASLGEAGDELVSTETCVGHRLLLRGREGVRLQFVDTAVRPEWRGRGVSSASIAFRQRTVAHLYDVSIVDAQSAVMIQRARKFGTRPLGNRIHPLVRPLRRREFGQQLARARRLPEAAGAPIALLLAARSLALRALPAALRAQSAALRAQSAALRAQSAAPASESGGQGRYATNEKLHLEAIERFDDRIDAFFAAAATPWELIMVRSRAHLDWRYCDRRAGDFHTRLALDSNGDVLGYAVGKALGSRGYLADLLALPGRLDVVAALVAEMDAVLARAGCVDVLCWLPERHPYRVVLGRAGYLRARRAPFITYRPCGATAEELEFLAAPDTRIHFTLGDTDLV